MKKFLIMDKAGPVNSREKQYRSMVPTNNLMCHDRLVDKRAKHKQYESSLPDRLALFAPNETFAKLGKVIVMRSDGSACCSNAQDFAGTVV